LAVSVAALLLSSAAMAQDKIVVRFLHNETDPPSIVFFNNAIKEFEAENPNVDVQMEAVSTDSRLQKVMASIAAHTMPDVFKLLPEERIDFAHRGFIADTDPIIDAIGRDDFDPASINKVDGKSYDIPYALTNSSVFFYRKDMLDAKGIAVPKTWDDLEKAAAALTGDGKYGFVMPAGKNRMTSLFLSSMLWSAGGTYFDKDLNVTFNNPGTIKALQFLKEMAKYSPPGIASYSYSDMINAYLTGTVAMDIYAPRLAANAATNRPDIFANTEATEMPAGPSGTAVRFVSSNSFALATPAVGAKNPDMALKFLQFLASGDRVKDFTLTAFPHLIPPLFSQRDAVIKAGSALMNGRDEFGEQAFSTVNGLDFDSEAGATIVDGKVVRAGVINPYIGPIVARDIPAQVVQRVVLQGDDPADAAKWGADQMQAIVDSMKKN
jgi:ABC-type glycerol-3-phosphate transport system substrate-binding protein